MQKTDLTNATAALSRGHILLYPTDTLYALGVDAHNVRAVEALTQLKQRPSEKMFSLSCSSIDMVSNYIVMTDTVKHILEVYTPGKITVIGTRNPDLDASVLPNYTTIAVRIPDDKIALALTASLGHAITATSANLSGQDTAPDPDSIANTFRTAVSKFAVHIIDDGVRNGSASTIVNCTGDQPFIVRQGELVVRW